MKNQKMIYLNERIQRIGCLFTAVISVGNNTNIIEMVDNCNHKLVKKVLCVPSNTFNKHFPHRPTIQFKV